MSAILTEAFRGSTQSLQTNAETVSRLVHCRFLQNPFKFMIHIHVSSYHSVLYDFNLRASCSPLDFLRVNSANEKDKMKYIV
jgi:hypothetical protein